MYLKSPVVFGYSVCARTAVLTEKRLHEQDREAGTMEFRLAQPGVLRRFEGRWQLTATASGGCELAVQQEVAPLLALWPPHS